MKFLIYIIVALFSFSAHSSNFSSFQKILDKHLVDISGPVQGYATAFNYEDAANDIDVADLVRSQKAVLASFDISTLDTKSKATAFWINVYNFSMIDSVLSKGVRDGELIINSVRKISGVFKKKSINVGGERLSLDGVEKGILLGKEYKAKGWKDARIHFAVNCASVGCPPVRTKVYKAIESSGDASISLDAVLEENVIKSFKTKRHLRVQDGKLLGTQLFQWYSKDFKEYVNKSGELSKTVNGFVLNFVDNVSIVRLAQSSSAPRKIKYNWDLNTQDNFINDDKDNLN